MHMVEFTDRKNELGLFKKKFKNMTKGELVILYGRRRVGKTELVRKFLDEIPRKTKAYIFVDEGTSTDMLRSISEDISAAWPEVRRSFSTWESFFSFLAERAEQRKTVVVMDEFQRMRTDPRAFARFQKVWDIKLKDKPIMIIFLGSVISAIHRIAINRKSPLFGRATVRFQLEPFDYQAFRQALPSIKDEELLIRLYSTFGGMPAYLEVADRCRNQSEYVSVVEEKMLEKSGILREEPQALLRMELKDTGRYNSILAAIAGGHRNPKEISDQTGIKPGTLVFYLNKLEKSLGLIKKISPVCGKHRPQYVFRDNLFRFWYHFIFRNLSALEMGNYEYVKKKIIGEMPAFEGRVFEEIIKELVAKYNGRNLKTIPVNLSVLGGWWGRKEGDIDLVGTEKNSLLAGEVKWTNEPVDVPVITELEDRLSFLKCSEAQRSNVHLLVVAKRGFTKSAKRYMEEKGVVGFTLDGVAALFDSLPSK